MAVASATADATVPKKKFDVKVSVDGNQALRTLGPEAFALNLTTDHITCFNDASVELWKELGVKMLRWPGGSDADSYDFTVSRGADHKSTADFAKLTERVGTDGYVILNYGSGSPQMAAAFVSYLNGSPSNAKVLGTGKRPSEAGKATVDFDWKTVGFWARLRGEAPLAKDDGLNHLRAQHPAPWGIEHFELGNEIMASWENDARPAGQKQDPVGYADFAKDSATLMHAADPKAKIGIVIVASEDVTWRDGKSAVYKMVTNPATGKKHGGWNALVFTELKHNGYLPDFLIDHFYPEPEKKEDDKQLLSIIAPGSTARDSNGALSWNGRATDYRQMLNDYFGKDGDKIRVMNTEHNSVSSNPGKQSTSLVNGLFYADSFGAVTRTEIGGFTWWLARSSATNGSMSKSLYGWRMYGDYGLLGDDGFIYFGDKSAPLPGRSSMTPYPTFFAAKLATLFVHPGDKVLDAKNDNKLVSTYAARSDAGLSFLVVNKSPDSSASLTFELSNFKPAPSGKLYQYGQAQDDAQAHGDQVKLVEEPLEGVSASFTREFPAYSMAVLTLPKGD